MPEHYHSYTELLENNKNWVKERLSADPKYFENLSSGQRPPYLYIGCSDSRKPLNLMTQTEPGEVFIHRNIANQIFLSDMNILSVLEFAVEVLKVRHIIVCGHHNCGGVEAALRGNAKGIVENWITPIRDLYLNNKTMLDEIENMQDRIDKLAELNVVMQVKNVLTTSIIKKACGSDEYPQIHGWIFKMNSGFIQEVELPWQEWRNIGLISDNYSS